MLIEPLFDPLLDELDTGVLCPADKGDGLSGDPFGFVRLSGASGSANTGEEEVDAGDVSFSTFIAEAAAAAPVKWLKCRAASQPGCIGYGGRKNNGSNGLFLGRAGYEAAICLCNSFIRISCSIRSACCCCINFS